jgi:hypothetical protein
VIEVKIIVSLFALAVAATASSTTAFATDRLLDGRSTNPNFVVYYPDGPHGIVGESGILHEGEDLVMRAGQSGNFLQWFYGRAEENGGQIEGDFSRWLALKEGHKCPDDFILVPDAYPEWGTYLEPNTDYCVKTTDFEAHNIPEL